MIIVRRIIGKIYHRVFEVLAKVLKQRGCVYMFHSVGDPRHDLNISIEYFERFLVSLNRDKIIRLEEWERKEGFACLTFDDVADSFYYNAYPLLKKYRIPFTIFVSCSLLDTEGFITTDMLREIAECELSTIGSHGWSHTFYADFSKEDAIADLSSSKRKLEELTHRSIEMYAFPYGSVYACGLKYKKQAGLVYKYGFGTIASPITKPLVLPNYYLPRIVVTEEKNKTTNDGICRS